MMKKKVVLSARQMKRVSSTELALVTAGKITLSEEYADSLKEPGKLEFPN
jgi:hypothetical protein